jgi:hypothetical protein
MSLGQRLCILRGFSFSAISVVSRLYRLAYHLRRETRRAVRRPVRRATLRPPNISILPSVVMGSGYGRGGQLAAAEVFRWCSCCASSAETSPSISVTATVPQRAVGSGWSLSRAAVGGGDVRRGRLVMTTRQQS